MALGFIVRSLALSEKEGTEMELGDLPASITFAHGSFSSHMQDKPKRDVSVHF